MKLMKMFEDLYMASVFLPHQKCFLLKAVMSIPPIYML